MKRSVLFVLSLLLVLTLSTTLLSGCAKKPQPTTPETTPTTPEVTEPETNPIMDYDTLDEARTAAGFDFIVPPLTGYTPRTYRIHNENLVDLGYDYEGNNVTFRAAQESSGLGPDISGINDEYGAENVMLASGAAATIRGENDKVSVLYWTSNGIHYSLHFAQPVDRETALALVEEKTQ